MDGTSDMDGGTGPVYVVADLHMGDGSETDAFAPRRARFERFLANVVEADPTCRLVLAGDIFEFWQGLDGSAQRAYAGLIERLEALRPVLLPGNHDVALICFGALRLEMPLLRRARMDLVLERGGRRIRVLHGHQFDRPFDPRRSIKGGLLVPALLSVLELRTRWRLCRARRGKGVFLLSRPGDYLARRLLNWHGRCVRERHGESPGKNKASAKLQSVSPEVLDAYHAKHPDEIVVAAHTHVAGLHDGWYVNTGAWHTERASYVRIAPDGAVTLHAWPGGEEAGTAMLPGGVPTSPAAPPALAGGG